MRRRVAHAFNDNALPQNDARWQMPTLSSSQVWPGRLPVPCVVVAVVVVLEQSSPPRAAERHTLHSSRAHDERRGWTVDQNFSFKIEVQVFMGYKNKFVLKLKILIYKL